MASDFVTRLIGNIDGLLLLFICLMMVGLFAGMLFSMGKRRDGASRHHAEAGSASNPGPKKPEKGSSHTPKSAFLSSAEPGLRRLCASLTA